MMNDTAIKNYAAWARRELVAEVGKRCLRYGIQLDADPAADIIDGRVLTAQERRQRTDLLRALKVEGYEQLVERAAYTWFNRLLAIRFMEVNDRLPSHVRVLSAPDGSFKSQALQEAMDLPIDALDTAKAADLVRAADDEALFRLVFLAQCAELAECMPAVFEPVGSDLELLLPTGLLRQGSVVERLVSSIPEENWREDVEIVGWMYQYYVSERKDEVFASFKKGKKAERDAIAPATQLFTPDWIVQYLTQNSLGRLWMLNRPESGLTDRMRYYVQPDDTAEVEFKHIASPEEITVVDPACGSGHILVYAFELLVAMYEEAGYTNRDAARLILEKNLSGMEIDPRAASLASFALTMKACELDSRFLRRGVTPRITVLARVEFSDDELALCPNLAANKALVDAAAHLDECGSLLQVSAADMDALAQDAAILAGDPASPAGAMVPSLLGGAAAGKIGRLRAELAPLAEAYDVVVANPPYMGAKNMNAWLSGWVKENYPDVKGDLFSCFMARNSAMGAEHAQMGFMTPYVWMFIGTYEKLRRFVIERNTITSLVQLEYSGFSGATVPICTFTLQKGKVDGYRGGYVRLSDFPGADQQAARASEALANPECGWFYRADAGRFGAIPGSPIAYWASKATIASFSFPPLGAATKTHLGMATCDNEKFLRLWHEVSSSKSARPREYPYAKRRVWFPYNKGGLFRKWYGNDEYLVNWENDGAVLKSTRAVIADEDLNFKQMISWSRVSSGVLAVRYKPNGFLFDMTGPAAFGKHDELCVSMALLNSSVGKHIAGFLSATIDFQPGQIANYPLNKRLNETPEIQAYVDSSIDLSKTDWDAFETSWDFKRHPLV